MHDCFNRIHSRNIYFREIGQDPVCRNAVGFNIIMGSKLDSGFFGERGMDDTENLKPICASYGCGRQGQIFYIDQNLIACKRHKSSDKTWRGISLDVPS